ncbi:hypothetical protein SteCoe_23395 [Stentor coeruleus]|uniref:histidine kinase n=1 Tax=Stentor coeruleus TaxID=5963 RepID=A0A1R2BK26_9CILI|nr:hypothetical protein SteCoe_23395 [Stentor coeruleus]
MNAKSWLRYFYPETSEDSIGSQLLEYHIGLIVLLSLSCSLCAFYYVDKGSEEFKIIVVSISVYFLFLPIAMKTIGKWQFFGLLCCVGWLVCNQIIGDHLPNQTIGLNFFQSLIPSYLLLATEDYYISTISAIIVCLVSTPYQYDNIYDKILNLEDHELKPYITSVLNATRDLNKFHLIATFGLTLWMSLCKSKEVTFMKTLKEAAEQARKSTEMFFAAFSHEFRNPLNALLGSLEILKDDVNCSKGKNKSLLQTALDCGEIISNMINNVLDASQIDCQMLVPSTSYVEPRYLIHKIVNICKSNVLRKNLRLELFIDKKLPKTLIMDSGRFSQILMNLVNNALKFTKEGIVRIKVQWNPDLNTVPKYWQRAGATIEYTEKWEMGNTLIISPESADLYRNFSTEKNNEFYGKTVLCEYWHESQGILTLSVDDTGIGISQESIKSLFKPFHQADATIKSTYGGSGLGLWISQSLSRILGGDLTLDSVLGKGSCFTLTLPCQVFDEKTTKQDSLNKSLQQCRVL